MIELRDYQSELTAAMREALRDGIRRLLVLLPTGGGKTVIFCFLAGSFRAKGRRCYIIVHRAELVQQVCKTLKSAGIHHGVIAAGTASSPDEPVQVCMIQTLARRLDKVPAPDWIICDEAHHAVSKTYADVIAAFPQARVLGFTATPERLDGKGLGNAFEEIVEGPPVSWLQEAKHLARCKYYAPPVVADFSSVAVTAGDYSKAGLAAVMSAPDVVGDCVPHYRRLSDGLPAVAFCCTVKHAQLVAERFNAAGIPAATIDGTLSPEARKQVVNDLAEGRIKVLTSCEIISEGFDLPAVTTAILLRKTKSLALHLQQIGRVLRPHTGKEFALVLDHVGNLATHGCADDPREWSLQGRAKRKQQGAMEAGWCQCPACYAMHKRAPACPECGYVRPAPPARERVEVDGDLEEFVRPPRLSKQEVREIVLLAKRPQDLIHLALRQGYRPGWAFKIFAEVRGEVTGV